MLRNVVPLLILLTVQAVWADGSSFAADLPPDVRNVIVEPAELRLEGPQSHWLLLIDAETADKRRIDVSHDARYRSLAPDIATVSATGLVKGISDGQTQIEITVGTFSRQVSVVVLGSQTPRVFNFENDVVPILSKFGCNTSGCHGKAEGQNGFKLSVFGFDPPADHAALTQEGRGRRVVPSEPSRSLLLAKVSGGMPHGGGVRIPRHTEEYALLQQWIAAGCPEGAATDPTVVSIEVTPHERQLSLLARQQLRVVATYSDGRKVDVTSHAKYLTNNEGLAQVSEAGLVSAGEVPGDVAIMASYMGAVDVFRTLIPRPQRIDPYPQVQQNNFIDGLVYAKLQKLSIIPSETCSDSDYLRRVFLDVIGTLPTAAEAKAFLSDSRPDKRARLVDELLQRPEFADYWALKWADVLRVDRQALGHKRAYAYYRWIRDSLAANKPYDQFCREIIASEGPINDAPGANLFKVIGEPGQRASTVSQVFLGIRIECAQCHHHPFDRWSQHDYFGMHAFFTQVSFKGIGDAEAIGATPGGSSVHPRTGENVFAHPLGSANPKEQPAGDRRKLFAAWLTAPDNPWFARNFANRMWAHFLGRGLVEPIDDFRLTNPPSNPELLDALGKSFVDSKYDVRQLIRTITASHVYQLSTAPNETNARDDQNYSRALFKRLDAEVLLDALCQTTAVPEKFPGIPAGARAVQVWDSQVSHYFLKLFGRPTRVSSCECERTIEPTVAQVLHVLNSPDIQGKLSHEAGRIARWSREISDDNLLADEVYLTFYARYPSQTERQNVTAYLKKHEGERRQAIEDLAWGMMNTVEFLFNH